MSKVGIKFPIGSGSSAGSGDFTAENKDAGTIYAGMAVAIHASGIGVIKAQADSIGTRSVGLAIADKAPTFAATIRTGGVLTLSDWTNVIGSVNLSAFAVYYLDESTAGMLTTTAPTSATQIVQRIGTAVSATSLDIEVEQPILL